MPIEYLLERRRRHLHRVFSESHIGWCGFLACALGLGGVFLAEGNYSLFPLLLLFFFFSWCVISCGALFVMWRYGSIWGELKSKGVFEEMVPTPSPPASQIDRVARYTLKRVLAIAWGPYLVITGLIMLDDPLPALWFAGALIGGALITIYLVQAWSLWSGLDWYWGILGIPLAAQLLGAICMAPLFVLEHLRMLDGELFFWLSPLCGFVYLAAVRSLAFAALKRGDLLQGALRWSRGQVTSRSLEGNNPVAARLLARFAPRRTKALLVAGLLAVGTLGLGLVGHLLINTSGHFRGFFLPPDLARLEGLRALGGGLLALAALAFWLGYQITSQERRSGNLQLLFLTNLKPAQMLRGWTRWALTGPGLMLLATLPAIVLGAWLFDCPVETLSFLVSGTALLVCAAVMGVASGLGHIRLVVPVVAAGAWTLITLTAWQPPALVFPLLAPIFLLYAYLLFSEVGKTLTPTGC